MTNTMHAARVFFATTSLAVLSLVASACVAGSGESQDGPAADQAAALEEVDALVNDVACKVADPLAREGSGGPKCGNGQCQRCAGESCETCPLDCGTCPVECGDGACEDGETDRGGLDYCPEDCGGGNKVAEPPPAVSNLLPQD